MATMAMAVFVKQEQAQNIRRKPTAPNYEHQPGPRDCLRLDKALYSFQENGQAKSYQKHAVDESTQSLCPLPLYCLSVQDFASTSNLSLLTPYVYIFELVFWLATLTAHRPTQSERTSLSYTKMLSVAARYRSHSPFTDHVKGVCNERKRMYPVAYASSASASKDIQSP